MQAEKKVKKVKQKLNYQFKQQCIATIKKQPPTYLMSSLKDKQVVLDLDLLQEEDIVCLGVLLQMPVSKMVLYCNETKKAGNNSPIYSSAKFREVLQQIAQAVSRLQSLKSLIFQRVPLTVTHISYLNQSLATTQHLKELSFNGCELSDQHLQIIQGAISKNESLVILDLCRNRLANVGGSLGKIISDHGARRDELVWQASMRGKTQDEDYSKRGLCEVNLQGNELNDRSASDMVNFLKDDQWTRCINLRNNKLGLAGVVEFAKLVKKNSSLISLDLRGNPGLNKELSVYILKKLKQNIEKYKEEKKNYTKKDHSELIEKQAANHHKSLEQSRKQLSHKKNQTTNIQFTLNNNNVTSIQKSANRLGLTEEHACNKCREKTVRVLKLQKSNLDLQIQIRKLKHYLLTKNIDISAIMPQQQPSPVNPSQINESFHRATQLNLNVFNAESDEDLIAKVEQIMMELTRIMQGIDTHQHTQINISNNISNVNSFSNTIPLFTNPSELEELEESSIQDKQAPNPGSQSQL